MQQQKKGFQPGNSYASMGGKARAELLSASRRRAIARLGWLARVQQHFHGDEQVAKVYIAELGRWAADPYDGDPVPRRFQHPGPVQDWLARRYQLALWEATK